MNPKRLPAFLSGAIPAAFCLVLSSTSAIGQPAPRAESNLIRRLEEKSVALKFEKASPADVLAALSDQIGLGILMDDAPDRTEVSFQFDGKAKLALDQLANLLDYTWTLSKRGLILMQKRFRNVESFPQVNLPELKQVTKDMVTILSALPFNPKSRDSLPFSMRRLFRTLTPEQMRILEEGGVLVAADLNAPQRELLQRCILFNAFASLFSAWHTLDARLDSLTKSYLMVCQEPDFQLKRAGGAGKSADAERWLELELFYWDRLRNAERACYLKREALTEEGVEP